MTHFTVLGLKQVSDPEQMWVSLIVDHSLRTLMSLGGDALNAASPVIPFKRCAAHVYDCNMCTACGIRS